MPPLVIYASRALTPFEEIADAVVVVEGDKIAAVGRRGEVRPPAQAREFDARGKTAAPGFVDVHIHGAGGRDIMDGDPASLDTIGATIARYGTTAYLPTTVTASRERTCRALQELARGIGPGSALQRQNVPVAEPLGFHLEGPFISHGRRGVHPAQWIVAPSVETLRSFLQAADGRVRILTLAPELPGAFDLIEEARGRGIVVSIGHTDATYEQTRAAIERGARHAVHVFNAMRPFSHRETGVLGAVLTSAEISAEVIADGVHVDAPAIRLLLAAKGVDRVLLVSDATAATDMPDGKYRLGSLEVTVAGGICRNVEGRLAGSTLTLDRALRNIVALGVSLKDALRMVTANPARLLGLERNKGILAPGADADLVLLGPNLEVEGVLTRGLGLG